MTEDTEIKIGKKDEKLTIGKSRGGGKKDKPKPLSKVVIRRLPPTMSEEEFLKQIDPLPEYDFYYYVPADWSLGFDATCRAYINFKNQEDIFLFKDRFDGYVFVDTKGAEYPAIVEFAAFQGLPKNRSRKIDPKANTIESDQHYLSFLEKLANDENEKVELKLEFTLQTNKDTKITSTPLLQYLANKKQERRDDRKRRVEEKRRQREEERHKKKISIVQKVPASIKEEENRGGYNSRDIDKMSDKRNGGERGSGRDRHNDDPKNSRSKRRAERDQRRRQERENRDRERDMKDRDRNSQEKRGQDNKSGGPSTVREDKKSQNNSYDDDSKRKEVKKYSQSRRDKMRSRNEAKGNDTTNSTQARRDSDNNINKNLLNTKDGSQNSLTNSATAVQDEEINETVKDFINSVAKIKEFVPRIRENVIETENKNNEYSDNLKDVNKTLANLSLDEKSWSKNILEKTTTEKDNSEYNEGEKSQQGNSRRGSRSSSSANEKNEKNSGTMENREIRRIRNKDRPSIAIYQPGKLRLGNRNDGRSSTEPPKDIKSNPTSDCESSKRTEKDDAHQKSVKKKVSRYSERRSNKSTGSKPKDDGIDNKHGIDNKDKQRRNSKDKAAEDDDTTKNENIKLDDKKSTNELEGSECCQGEEISKEILAQEEILKINKELPEDNVESGILELYEKKTEIVESKNQQLEEDVD